MAAPMRERFRISVTRVLNSWTVLKLAVSHGFGGAESQAKAEWLVTAIDQWFAENNNIETYELEDFLEDILDAEFNTVADDGSLAEISRLICGFYRLCKDGDEENLKTELEKLPQSGENACQSVANGHEDSDSGEEDAGIDPDTPPPLVPVQHQPTDNQMESMDTSGGADEGGAAGADDEGWTTVGKKHRKR